MRNCQIFILSALFALLFILPASAFGDSKLFAVTSSGHGQCPQSLPGLVESGCLKIPENPSLRRSRTIQIYFGFAKPFDSKQSTIIVLNGGPGETAKVYSNAPELRALSKNFNVMFYDQRGIGMSSVITNENQRAADLTFYSTPVNSWDIEQLRKYVISPKYPQQNSKIIIVGHSYGGHLAYQYATDCPNNVEKLVVLNGAST